MPRKTEGGVWKVEREFLGKFTTKELVEKEERKVISSLFVLRG